jgi:hypothetical protein
VGETNIRAFEKKVTAVLSSPDITEWYSLLFPLRSVIVTLHIPGIFKADFSECPIIPGTLNFSNQVIPALGLSKSGYFKVFWSHLSHLAQSVSNYRTEFHVGIHNNHSSIHPLNASLQSKEDKVKFSRYPSTSQRSQMRKLPRPAIHENLTEDTQEATADSEDDDSALQTLVNLLSIQLAVRWSS